MYVNMNNNLPIGYDETIIEKIRKMIETGIRKLKSFVNSRKSKFKQYSELKEKFLEIAISLEKYDFLIEEFNYFLSIKNKILYIIRKNCENPFFGHCSFALELFNLFLDIWNIKIKFLTGKIEAKQYDYFQKEFKRAYRQYRRKYYLEIHEDDPEFSEQELYEMHKHLRG